MRDVFCRKNAAEREWIRAEKTAEQDAADHCFLPDKQSDLIGEGKIVSVNEDLCIVYRDYLASVVGKRIFAEEKTTGVVVLVMDNTVSDVVITVVKRISGRNAEKHAAE